MGARADSRRAIWLTSTSSSQTKDKITAGSARRRTDFGAKGEGGQISSAPRSTGRGCLNHRQSLLPPSHSQTSAFPSLGKLKLLSTALITPIGYLAAPTNTSATIKHSLLHATKTQTRNMKNALWVKKTRKNTQSELRYSLQKRNGATRREKKYFTFFTQHFYSSSILRFKLKLRE